MSPAVDYSRLAAHYDALVSFDADISFFLQECRQAEGAVLELMSGTGRVSLPLAKAGVELTCVDSSAEMLTVLRGKLTRQGLSAEILHADVAGLDLEDRFDLAILPFNSFEELVEPKAQEETIRRVHRALVRGGRFVCTLHNPTVAVRSLPQQPTVVATAKQGDTRLVLELDVQHDPETGIVEGKETLLKMSAAGRVRSREELPLRYGYVDRGRFAALVRGSGFEIVEILGDYDRAPFDRGQSPLMIWRLRK